MSERDHRPPSSGQALTWWFGLMALAGLAFGVYSERSPFGDHAYPLAWLLAVAIGLLTLRLALGSRARLRIVVIGCLLGLVGFLLGGWFGFNLAAMR